MRINPNGTGLVNNQRRRRGDAAEPGRHQHQRQRVHGQRAPEPVLPAATRPPRGVDVQPLAAQRRRPGRTQQVSDLAPDDGNSPVQTVAPARVASVVVNDGSAQRSMVNSLTVTFDGPVTLDPGAFELSRQDGSSVELTVAASVVNGQTVAVLTFAGPDVVGGSLADGSYTLTVRGDLVHDRWGRELDGDGGRRRRAATAPTPSSGCSATATATATWTGCDRDRFRPRFGRRAGDAGYLWYFDFDGDGDVDRHATCSASSAAGSATHLTP